MTSAFEVYNKALGDITQSVLYKDLANICTRYLLWDIRNLEKDDFIQYFHCGEWHLSKITSVLDNFINVDNKSFTEINVSITNNVHRILPPLDKISSIYINNTHQCWHEHLVHITIGTNVITTNVFTMIDKLLANIDIPDKDKRKVYGQHIYYWLYYYKDEQIRCLRNLGTLLISGKIPHGKTTNDLVDLFKDIVNNRKYQKVEHVMYSSYVLGNYYDYCCPSIKNTELAMEYYTLASNLGCKSSLVQLCIHYFNRGLDELSDVKSILTTISSDLSVADLDRGLAYCTLAYLNFYLLSGGNPDYDQALRYIKEGLKMKDRYAPFLLICLIKAGLVDDSKYNINEIIKNGIEFSNNVGDSDMVKIFEDLYYSINVGLYSTFSASYMSCFEGVERCNMQSIFELAEHCWYGKGCLSNKNQAKFYYKAAMQYGHDGAKRWINVLNCLVKDDIKGIQNCIDSYISLVSHDIINPHYANYELKLATIYFEGICVPVNLDEAIKWYRSAAKHGCCYSQFTIAKILESRNLDESIEYYRMAAKSGLKDANDKLILLVKS